MGLALAALSACTLTQDLDGIFCERNCKSQQYPDSGTEGGVEDEDKVEGRLYVVAGNIDTDSPANRIRLELGLVNQTDKDVQLSQLTVRYYFTVDVGTKPAFQCNFVPLTLTPGDCDHLSVSFPQLTPNRANADHAIEIGFSDKAGVLRAFGGDTGLMKLSVSGGNRDFDQTNDYSFRAGTSDARVTGRITIHQGGRLIWGQPP